MTDQPPVLNQWDLVVRDIDASLAFYRCVGLEIPESTVWRTANGAHYVGLHLPNGFHLHLDSVALATSFNSGWPEVTGAGTKTIRGFAAPAREKRKTARDLREGIAPKASEPYSAKH